jgi:hypothetical protein
MRAALLFLTLSLSTIGCRRTASHTASVATGPDTLVAGTFITAPGEYHGHEGRFTRTIKLTGHGTSIAYSIITEKGTSGDAADHQESVSALVLEKPTDPWFVYAESPARLWLCDGHANVYACFVSANGANEHHQLANSGHRTTDEKPLPAAVYQRLPEPLRLLFPVPEEKVEQPSF